MLVILISDNYPGPSPNWSTSLYNTNIHVFSYKHGVYIKLLSYFRRYGVLINPFCHAYRKKHVSKVYFKRKSNYVVQGKILNRV